MLFDGRHVAGRGASASAVNVSKILIAVAGLNEIID